MEHLLDGLSETIVLQPRGIEKGKPFKPDARQQKILTQALFSEEGVSRPDVGPARHREGKVNGRSVSCAGH